MVFIAAIPVAPASIAAIAGTSMRPTLGVIFAKIGSFVPFLVAFVYMATSSGFCPTSDPNPSSTICGHEKLHSIISAPASVIISASFVHSCSFCPIIDATITFVG